MEDRRGGVEGTIVCKPRTEAGAVCGPDFKVKISERHASTCSESLSKRD